MKESNKKKKPIILDIARDGKGISKKEPLNPAGLKRFFITCKNNFGKLILVNMIMVLGNFPLLFLIATLSGYTKSVGYMPLNDIGQNLLGLFSIEEISASSLSLYALEGMQAQVLVDTLLTYVFYGIAALTLLTFGIVNVGCAYILRNFAMGEPVFVFTDFWYAVRRNWKQALPFGIADGFITALLVFNLYTTMTSTSDFVVSMMFWSNVILFVLYYFMRGYIYIQIVTFDMKIFKILKNSLIFSLLGLKRNFLAFIGCVLLVLLEVMFLFTPGGILLPFAVALPLLIFFSGAEYMRVFAAYFKVKEIIIDPYKAEHPELYENEAEDDEVVMHDDVTERERLEEIKRKNNIQ